MQWPQSSHACYDPSASCIPSSVATGDRNVFEAKVISLDVARAILRRREQEHRMTQAGIMAGLRENVFVLQDEPLLQFGDFHADP